MKKDLDLIYHRKIKILNETIWEKKATYKKVKEWLNNFEEDERIQALFLLTQFIYIGEFQIEKMLISIYRDFFKYSQVEKIRINNSDTLDNEFIDSEYQKILEKTRFVALGNPSESSSSFMYPFRKHNRLSKKYFISDNDIVTCKDSIENFVFIDDMCGSGSQAVSYSKDILPLIKSKFPDAKNHYYMLFATKEGKEKIKEHSQFDFVDSITELDESFKCFEEGSRVFKNIDDQIDIDIIEGFSSNYGKRLMSSICKLTNPGATDEAIEGWGEAHKLGFGNGQLLLGFNHNTPDNTLPIFWYNEKDVPWTPIFKRINKIYE